MGFILSLVPNWADAEDIAQEVKIRLWKQFDGYDPTKDFGAWARTIARYMVLAFRERQSRQNRLVSSRFVELVAEEAAAISEDLDAEQQALKDCFEKLPEAKRELLYLRYYPGRQTVQEIAAKLGRDLRGHAKGHPAGPHGTGRLHRGDAAQGGPPVNDRPTGNLTESDPDPKRQEIYNLANALLSGEITATEANRLEDSSAPTRPPGVATSASCTSRPSCTVERGEK